MFLYRTRAGWMVQDAPNGKVAAVPAQEDELTTREDLFSYLQDLLGSAPSGSGKTPVDLLAPIDHQEVWAAGVTYFRSRDARMAESKDAGGGDFYSRVYDAARPELFFKATPSRVVGPGEPVRIRSDSSWNVPEPELTVLISPKGKILGYTAGNDMSSRSIEGENPLYLPQAKVYDRSCALGPRILVTQDVLPATSRILLEIERRGSRVFEGKTTLAELKRQPPHLVEYLFRDNLFPNGCFLMTGTGVIPPDDFTLQNGDEITIQIDGIGKLQNRVG